MNSRIKSRLARWAVAGLVSIPSVAEEPFICGSADESHMGLQKASASQPLPAIREYKGVLKAYVFIVDFSDTKNSVTDTIINKNNIIINDFYKSMSRNKFYWEFIVHPTPLVLPGTSASYGTNFNAVQSDVNKAVAALPIRRGTDYAVYNVTFPKMSLSWSGMSTGGTSGSNWMNGSYGTTVTAHEMGHTVGLAHAHAIKTAPDMWGTPGTTSQHEEYGHPFDVMGRGGSNGHFNICYKYRDGWTDGPTEVQEITTSGTYRIYSQDNSEHKERLIGIRVPSGDSKYGYWFEYHSNSAQNRLGATVMLDGWNGTSSRADTWFLDLVKTTPSQNDGVMKPGTNFKDKFGLTTFEVTAVNAAAGAEGWVDVKVNYNGIVGIQPKIHLNNQLRLSRWTPGIPAFSMMGRSLQDLSSSQALVLLQKDGDRPSLVLEAR